MDLLRRPDLPDGQGGGRSPAGLLTDGGTLKVGLKGRRRVAPMKRWGRPALEADEL